MKHAWKLGHDEPGQLNDHAWTAQDAHHGYECNNCGRRIDVRDTEDHVITAQLKSECTLIKRVPKDDSGLILMAIAGHASNLEYSTKQAQRVSGYGSFSRGPTAYESLPYFDSVHIECRSPESFVIIKGDDARKVMRNLGVTHDG